MEQESTIKGSGLAIKLLIQVALGKKVKNGIIKKYLFCTTRICDFDLCGMVKHCTDAF